MDKKKIISFLLLLFLVVPPVVVRGGLPEAVNYLKQQPPDDWLTMALVAGGQNQVATGHLKIFNGSSATDYAKRILAVKAIGQNPTSFTGVDLVAGLKAMASNNQLGDKDLLNDDAWGLIALLNAGAGASDAAVRGAKNYLLSNQNSDGGWSYAVGGESDTNDTAAVVMALSYAGLSASDSSLQAAINYLKQAQNSDGGWPYAIGGESDTGSTAWVASALTASGQAGLNLSKSGHSASQFLQSQQLNNGSYKWLTGDSTGSPIMTAFAVVALSNKFYPVPPLQISQSNQAPQVAHLSGPLNVICGQSNTFSAGAQDSEAGNLSFVINWGDGTVDSQANQIVTANQVT
ncbi:MAG: prenyltransferase/squalene oxidase repeat-containing protein, partial [Patescibacteria group bacterium]